MRDLEIRGAGELLGAKQHGQIVSVGFDLYTRLLTQSVNEMREKRDLLAVAMGDGAGVAQPASGNGDRATHPPGQQLNEGLLPITREDPLAPPVTLDLPLRAEIPATYVEEEGLRLQLYRRIAGLNSQQELEEMRGEIEDRFGKDSETNSIPLEMENLFYQIRVKMEALRAGILNIGRRRESDRYSDPARVSTACNRFCRRSQRGNRGRFQAQTAVLIEDGIGSHNRRRRVCA